MFCSASTRRRGAANETWRIRALWRGIERRVHCAGRPGILDLAGALTGAPDRVKRRRTRDMARTLYMQELESVRQNLIQMGEATTALLAESIQAVSRGDSGS